MELCEEPWWSWWGMAVFSVVVTMLLQFCVFVCFLSEHRLGHGMDGDLLLRLLCDSDICQHDITNIREVATKRDAVLHGRLLEHDFGAAGRADCFSTILVRRAMFSA